MTESSDRSEAILSDADTEIGEAPQGHPIEGVATRVLRDRVPTLRWHSLRVVAMPSLFMNIAVEPDGNMVTVYAVGRRRIPVAEI